MKSPLLIGAMETPQHGNALTRNRTQKTETSPKWFFLRRFLFFSKIIGNPSNPIFKRNFPFFYPFPRFLGRIPVYQGLILWRDFPIFLRDFPIFSIRFLIFLGPFPVFRKSLKFSVYWSVSSFFGVRFLFFGGPFPVFKKVLNSQFVDRFPLFFRSVSGFQKRILKSHSVSRFPLYLGPFPVFKKC